MLWIHPIWQFIAIVIGVYVLYLGWVRFAFAHLGRKGMFNWKRHVRLGKLVHFMWFYGAMVGAAAAWVVWRTFGVTNIHFRLGLTIVLLAIFGYASGNRMDLVKKKRKFLPLFHGTANLLAILCSLISIYTGLKVIGKYILHLQ